MIRTQIQLTDRQARRLKALASRQGVSMAELIRRAVDRALATEVIPDQDEIRQRARRAVGFAADSAHDVAEHHDRYLGEAFDA
jgi:hypothetical protein